MEKQRKNSTETVDTCNLSSPITKSRGNQESFSHKQASTTSICHQLFSPEDDADSQFYNVFETLHGVLLKTKKLAKNISFFLLSIERNSINKASKSNQKQPKQSDSDESWLEGQLAEGFTAILNQHPAYSTSMERIILTASIMVQKTIQNKDFTIKLNYGDIEFIFWSCFYISLKSILDFDYPDLESYSLLIKTSIKILWKTERFILIEILKFNIGDILISSQELQKIQKLLVPTLSSLCCIF